MTAPRKVLVIVGATASGKTALGVELARRFDGEVISADSRQVYRGLDIGTGKVTTEETQGVPHHLLDVADPRKTFTAHDFVVQGRQAIADIASRGKLPIIVGGTGFYIDALLGRMTLAQAPRDEALRATLADQTTEELQALLQEADPARLARMNASDRQNPVRLIRALEVAAAPADTGDIAPAYDTLWLGIRWPKEELAARIEKRLDDRLAGGMIEEAEHLHAGGLSYERKNSVSNTAGSPATCAATHRNKPCATVSCATSSTTPSARRPGGSAIVIFTGTLQAMQKSSRGLVSGLQGKSRIQQLLQIAIERFERAQFGGRKPSELLMLVAQDRLAVGIADIREPDDMLFSVRKDVLRGDEPRLTRHRKPRLFHHFARKILHQGRPWINPPAGDIPFLRLRILRRITPHQQILPVRVLKENLHADLKEHTMLSLPPDESHEIRIAYRAVFVGLT
jgi:tRNA dimethylallyltransferase